MPEMQKAISRLRFQLAAIRGKEEELENLSRQLEGRLNRAPGYAVQGDNSLDVTLEVMEEIEERLDKVERMQMHLTTIKKRAQDDLRALDLTGKIERAKMELAPLKARQNSVGQRDDARKEKIKELERFIEEASIRAGEARP